MGAGGGGLAACGAPLGLGGDGGEVVEGFGECVVVDFFGVDLEAFEEGVVEEAAFGWVGSEVGGLDVVGEFECDVEGVEDGLVVDLVALEEFLGCVAFASDASLFFVEDVVADGVRVVGV